MRPRGTEVPIRVRRAGIIAARAAYCSGVRHQVGKLFLDAGLAIGSGYGHDDSGECSSMGRRQQVECRPNVVDHQDIEAGNRMVCPTLRRYYRG